MNPINRAILAKELRRDEGVRNIVYFDKDGNPTTGVGHNLNVSPLPVGWTYPLTDAQITQLLNDDLDVVFGELNARWPWWTTLDTVRQRIMANMCFNMGAPRLSGFHFFLKDLEEGYHTLAAAEMTNSAWFGEVGDRAVRLHQAMLTGVMPI